MSSKLVIHTNSHLRNPKARAQAVCKMVGTSFAVENIHVKVEATEHNDRYQFNSTVIPKSRKKQDIVPVKDKLIIHTNPHLRDPKKRAEAVARMVESSSAIEVIYVEITPVPKENGEYGFDVKNKKQNSEK